MRCRRRLPKLGRMLVTTFFTRGCALAAGSAALPSVSTPSRLSPSSSAAKRTISGSDSRPPKSTCNALFSSSSSEGTSSVTRPRSRRAARMISDGGSSALAICCSWRPRNTQAAGKRGPSSAGRRASAARAHRHKWSSSGARVAAALAASASPAARAAGLSTARHCVALSASSRRWCTCSAQSTSAGSAAPLAFFFGGCPGPPQASAAASTASSAAADCSEVSSLASRSTTAPTGAAGGPAAASCRASVLPGSPASSGAELRRST
mmetsp:Transcript_53988/g.145558  ORF Transcript_53988/g.145558 Transcript_53988/m.145558 type:complete len:265 (+) Transcript_53988:237-1031(+)